MRALESRGSYENWTSIAAGYLDRIAGCSTCHGATFAGLSARAVLHHKEYQCSVTSLNKAESQVKLRNNPLL